MDDQPNNHELREFLNAFKRLESFEAQQRHVRGYGAFKVDECPMPAVVKVIGWLRRLESDEGTREDRSGLIGA